VIRALTTCAVVAWSVGAAAMPIAAWIWLRRDGRRPALALVAFAAGLVAQVAWLYEIAANGLGVLLIPERGPDGVFAWGLGVTGVAALISSVGAGSREGPGGLLVPDRALQLAFGLFGLGVLLRQIALTLT
jgi:hypothetical protein